MNKELRALLDEHEAVLVNSIICPYCTEIRDQEKAYRIMFLRLPMKIDGTLYPNTAIILCKDCALIEDIDLEILLHNHKVLLKELDKEVIH